MWKLQTAVKGVVSYRIKSLNVLYCQAGSIMEPQPSLNRPDFEFITD